MCSTPQLIALPNNNDGYALFTAQTGIGNISNANPFLNGAGPINTILTAPQNRSISIRSITIQATGATAQGMVRLYIGETSNQRLFREIPIPATTPTSVVPAFSFQLTGSINLPNSYFLSASTEIGNSFNIIIEAEDWHYPDEEPDVCCTHVKEVANVGMNIVSTGNPSRNGTGPINPIFTAGGDGSYVKTVTVKALQSNSEGMVRLFLSRDGGSTYALFQEIYVPASIQTGTEQAFELCTLLALQLQSGYIIGASTEQSESFNIIIEGTDRINP